MHTPLRFGPPPRSLRMRNFFNGLALLIPALITGANALLLGMKYL